MVIKKYEYNLRYLIFYIRLIVRILVVNREEASIRKLLKFINRLRKSYWEEMVSSPVSFEYFAHPMSTSPATPPPIYV